MLMQSSISTKPRQAQSDDSLIPLINVVFLMLIFFMVAGKISQSDPVSIDPPVSHQESKVPDIKHRLLLTVQQQLYLDDELLGQLDSALAVLGQRLTILNSGMSDESLALTLKVDKSFPAQDLAPLLYQLKQSGLQNITLLTQSQPKEQ